MPEYTLGVPEVATGLPVARVTDTLEPTDVGGRNKTLMPWKSSKSSEVLSHLSRLCLSLFFLVCELHRIKQSQSPQKGEVTETIKSLFLLRIITTLPRTFPPLDEMIRLHLSSFLLVNILFPEFYQTSLPPFTVNTGCEKFIDYFCAAGTKNNICIYPQQVIKHFMCLDAK